MHQQEITMPVPPKGRPIRKVKVKLSYEGCTEFRHFISDLLAQAPETQERGRPRVLGSYLPPPRNSSVETRAAIERVLEYFWIFNERGRMIERMDTVSIDTGDLSEAQIGTSGGLTEVYYEDLLVLRDSTPRKMHLRSRLIAPLLEGYGLDPDHIFCWKAQVGSECGSLQWACLLSFAFLAWHLIVETADHSTHRYTASRSQHDYSFPSAARHQDVHKSTLRLPSNSVYYPSPQLARGIQGCGMSAPEVLSHLDIEWDKSQAHKAARRRKREELREFISRLWLSCQNEPPAMTEVLLSVWPNEKQARALLAIIQGFQRDGPEYVPGEELLIQLGGCGMTLFEVRQHLVTEWHRSQALQRRIEDTRRVLTIRYSQYVAGTVDEAVEVVNGSLTDEQVTSLDLFVNDFHTEGSSYQPTEDVVKAIEGYNGTLGNGEDGPGSLRD
ncbi:hypothetical protein HII31_03772, partial [Pseudocercospora fuligena]